VVSTTRAARGAAGTGLNPDPARTPIGPRLRRGVRQGLRL
jgi:hypothetical protein